MKKPTGMTDKWFKLLEPLFMDKRFSELVTWLRGQKPFSPDFQQVFRVFSMLEPDDVKCIITGLSPYQGITETGFKIATGIPFGIENTDDTPSLRCIKDALCQDTGIITIEDYFDPSLVKWVEQGVLLLNVAMTVKTQGQARSHLAQWNWFMEGLFQILNEKYTAMPFVFLGADAIKMKQFIDNRNYVIEAYHPAAVYYDSKKNMAFQKVFKQIDEITFKTNQEKINWLWNL